MEKTQNPNMRFTFEFKDPNDGKHTIEDVYYTIGKKLLERGFKEESLGVYTIHDNLQEMMNITYWFCGWSIMHKYCTKWVAEDPYDGTVDVLQIMKTNCSPDCEY